MLMGCFVLGIFGLVLRRDSNGEDGLGIAYLIAFLLNWVLASLVSTLVRYG